ncbi:MAG: hypothetical protein HC817_13585 [Saprospiraceae bacterium]|nr:hypothetical protein [Saprospiraceae bacterium]
MINSTFSKKQLLIFLSIILCSIQTLPAQDFIWTGAVNNDWNNANNWNPVGVPGFNDDVLLANVTNEPILNTSASAAVVIQAADAEFTINSGITLIVARIAIQGTLTNNGTLYINGSPTSVNTGVLNSGTITNNGTIQVEANCDNSALTNKGTFNNNALISIGQISSINARGIVNEGTFNHNKGAIYIDRTKNFAVHNISGTFTCNGGLYIGAINTVNGTGICNVGVFNSSGSAIITIDRTTSMGFECLSGGVVNNGATLKIGETQTIGAYGIKNEGTFRILMGSGAVSIDRANTAAINNLNTFENAATLNIGNTISNGQTGITNGNVATFENKTNGIININRSITDAIYNEGSFTNVATITLGAIASVGTNGIRNSASTSSFSNNAGGSINIGRSTFYAINNGGAFTNIANITLGGTQSVGFYGIHNTQSFTNSSGHIRVDRSISAAVINLNNASFINSALITIGGIATNDGQGLSNFGTFNNNLGGVIKIDRTVSLGLGNYATFNNAAALTIGSQASVGSYGIYNNASFNNNTGGNITIDNATETGVYLQFGTFANSASLAVGQNVNIPSISTGNSGILSNNIGGVVKGTGFITPSVFIQNGGTLSPGYSPGKIDFFGDENLTTGILSIEIPNIGIAGTHFDQVNSFGILTLGGTLDLNITHTPTDGNSVIIIDATALSGTFSTITGLPNGWIVEYNEPNTGKVRLRYATVLLPVEWLSFNVKKDGKTHILTWETASEKDNAQFVVERSREGRHFESIGYVKGGRLSNQLQNYIFYDKNPFIGINYYRLMQEDANGKSQYSKIISTESSTLGDEADIKIYPSVSTGNLTIEGASAIEILNLSGQIVLSKPQIEGAFLSIANLPKGIYLVIAYPFGFNKNTILKLKKSSNNNEI